MPGRRGFGGPELTEALCEILDVFFYFFCFVYSCSDDHAEQNLRDRAGVVVSWRVLLFFVLISVVPILDEKCTVGFGILEENCRIIFLACSFVFFCFVYSCSDDHAEQNRRDRAGVVVS